VTARSYALTKLAWSALGGDPGAADEVVFSGAGGMSSVFAVTDLASATVAAAALSVAELIRHARGSNVSVSVDRRLSSMWFGLSLRPIGWTLPMLWDPIAGDYRTRDGWIRLHTNAPHHRAAAERVVGSRGDREAIARAVASWSKADLESSVVEAGGCAAEMRSITEWEQHPQGRAVADEPLIHIQLEDSGPAPAWSVPAARPLEGVRVLDLTRVLAGPVASRFLAGYGADVLRIDPPGWDEPGVVPEVTLGKRCARLDLHTASDRVIFEALLSQADVLLHGYRPGALDGLGFGPATRRRLSPGLVDVCLDAYGWSGPWATRRGFDSLVQMSIGIADAGMRQLNAERPAPLPVQALDYATGYLMAAAAVRAVVHRLKHGGGIEARLSLARLGKFLIDHGADHREAPLLPEMDADRCTDIEATDWGNAQRVAPPARVAGAPMWWNSPARRLGSAAPCWKNG
jgi:crotonobetainyl-CoA:carnitine CoA-transferase CaiB-like acyl-CoA transferase